MKESSIGIKELLKEIGWGRSKFYATIDEFCKFYGLDKKALTVQDEMSKVNPNTFSIKNEWKDLLIALFKIYDENPIIRKNATKAKSMAQLKEYKQKVLQIIDEIPDEWSRYSIKVHPAYMLAVAELGLEDIAEKSLEKIMWTIAEAPIEIRVLLWINLGQWVDAFSLDVAMKIQQAKKEIDAYKGEVFEELLKDELKYTSIDRIVANTLKDLLDNDYRDKMKKVTQLEKEACDELDAINIKISKDTQEVQKEINNQYMELGLDEEKMFYTHFIEPTIKENVYSLKKSLQDIDNVDVVAEKVRALEIKIQEAKENISYYNKVLKGIDNEIYKSIVAETILKERHQKVLLKKYEKELDAIKSIIDEIVLYKKDTSFKEEAKNFKDAILLQSILR